MSYKDLVKRLEDEGFETYLVGGALRDKLLGKKSMILTLQQGQGLVI